MVRLGSEVLLGLPSSAPTSPFVADPLGRSQDWEFRHLADEQKYCELLDSQRHRCQPYGS